VAPLNKEAVTEMWLLFLLRFWDGFMGFFYSMLLLNCRSVIYLVIL